MVYIEELLIYQKNTLMSYIILLKYIPGIEGLTPIHLVTYVVFLSNLVKMLPKVLKYDVCTIF